MRDYSTYFYKKMPNENFFVDVFEKKHNVPGTVFRTHWHEHLQFFYFASGKALMKCNSESIDVLPGDLIIINGNELHCCENLSNNLDYYAIRVDLSFLFSNQIDSCQTKFMIPLSQNLILFQHLIRDDEATLKCINNIIQEYLRKKIGFELAIKSSIYELIVILIRKYVTKIFSQKELDSKVNNLRRLTSIIKYIENNFCEYQSISKLGAMANMSNYHFCRAFKEITGISAINYINNLRIEKAVSLLKKTDYNITEVAMHCGFNDTNYFSRLFKKYKNISPRQIRKK